MSNEQSLEQQLRAAETRKAGQYDKRTEHLADDGSAVFINRLILEDSPYLLQHAHNPVNWYPWGTEAFEAARADNKPVFLSIGYSTCHWCHVMEVESFDNVQIGQVLNEHFISIKMDREQYPDIDEIYMTGVQLMTGHGGWPMSNFLLPDGRPFFGATYFPLDQFMQLLQQISTAWKEKYSELETSAASIHQAIGRILNSDSPSQSLDSNIFQSSVQALCEREDRSLGGLAGAPKFPQEPILLFMLEQALSERDESAFAFLERALDAMGRGGICDQVGGGFHRYSVDEHWLVPHFEKMLYNQSQLGLLYTEACRVSGSESHRRTVRRTLDYVLAEMQLDCGGFYSATDADSEGAEGTFFLWTPEQIRQVLDEEAANLIIDVFNVSRTGNFEGSNILHLSADLASLQQQHGADVIERIDRALRGLYREREKRIHPLRDDKLIVAWSAAMATTLAHAGQSLGETRWLDAAEKAVQLMLDRCLADNGSLYRIYLNGEVSVPGQLEDYANLIQSLLMLYRIGNEAVYLQSAQQLMQTVIAEFHDSKTGLFYLGPAQQSGPKLVRSTNASDGATVSAVATLMENLWWLESLSLRLSDPSEARQYRSLREQCLTALAAEVNSNPLSNTSLMRAFKLDLQGSRGPIQFAAQGMIRVQASKQLSATKAGSESTTGKVRLAIHCSDNWHLVAPDGGSESGEPSPLAAISVSMMEQEKVWQIEAVKFPQATDNLKVPGATEAVPIYSGQFDIEVTLVKTTDADALSGCVSLSLDLQACSESECLLPETLRLVI